MLMSSYTGFISPVKIIEKHMAGPSTPGGPGVHGPPTFLQGNEIFNYHFCSFVRSSILDPFWTLLIPCRRPWYLRYYLRSKVKRNNKKALITPKAFLQFYLFFFKFGDSF